MNQIVLDKRNLLKKKVEAIKRMEHQPLPGMSAQYYRLLDRNYIWDSVLGHLTDPKDVLNAARSNPSFYAKLQPRLVDALLPEVLRILRAKGHLTFSIEPDAQSERADFLNLRLVSKSWKLGVARALFEDTFEEDSCYSNLEECFETRGYFTTPVGCVFRYGNEVGLAYSIFSSPHADQALVRHLYIEEPEKQVHWDSFIPCVFGFLEEHGNSVWALKFRGYHRESPESYRILCELLSLMPNLKSFTLSSNNRPFHLRGTSEDRFVAFTQLMKLYVNSPLPLNSALEHFEGDYDWQPILADKLLQKCVQMKSVMLNPCDDVSHAGMQALKGMRLVRCQTSFSQFTDEGGRLLPEFMTIATQWPIRDLRLGCSDHYIKLSELFKFANQFHATLTRLEVYDELVKDDGDVKIDLPNLQILHLKGTHNCKFDTISFDEFLPLRNLEEMSVRMGQSESENSMWWWGNSRKETLQLRKYVRRMEKSNIWSLFPKLRTYEIHVFYGENKWDHCKYFKEGGKITRKMFGTPAGASSPYLLNLNAEGADAEPEGFWNSALECFTQIFCYACMPLQ